MLVIAIVAIAGAGLTGVYIGVPLAAWALYARLARGEMLVLREQHFMLATSARLLAHARDPSARHAEPHAPELVYSAADIVLNLLLLASLSYLGLGVQPPGAELGTMIAEGSRTS